ncbi:PucR family transcriptional regulator [Alkalicoccus chagannorensis]|uniref:PucR family transcriptional regulator n=1 Tax=Alkalicoccus chagannorensis TaxID=427072 RepID=UPI0004171F9E|nr:helix-turn-helix domain-containing protein [Alkalicoccus chagannorensis]
MITLTYGRVTKQLDEAELTTEEQALLKRLVHEDDMPALHPADENLRDYLIDEKEVPQSLWAASLTFPLRIISVKLTSPIDDEDGFAEAVQSFFPGGSTFLWRSRREGFLLQSHNEDVDQDDSPGAIIDTLAADFYQRPSIAVGTFVTKPANVKKQLDWETHVFREAAAAFPEKHVYTEQELTLYFMLSTLSEQTLKDIRVLLESVMDDTTLLESIRMYLECNMNVSMAAKKLFMHRNTMQYRVDKFIEKTSIDIKKFANATAVYLLLLAVPVLYRED